MKSRILPVILTAAATSVATLFVAGQLSDRPLLSGNAQGEKLPVNYARFDPAAPPTPGAPPVDFEQAAAASTKAVVHITTKTKGQVREVYDPFSEFFGGDGRRRIMLPPQMGSGSGVVFSPDGYIVTNNHVVAGAEELTVTFNDRITTTAKVVGTDPSTDLAVIKVEEKGLDYMEFGNSDDVRLGQWVLAVGYPLSLEATVTAGIVSAKSRSIGINRSQGGADNPIESFIQTDAAVNPGNSGGALVNTAGQLIGINSAIASPTGSYAGYSYAVPSNIVRKVANDLVQYGSFQRGYLGVSYRDRKTLSAERIRELGLDRTDGVYVASVLEKSGADKAGLREGDIITAINGVAVATEPDLLGQIARYKPGDNVSVTYLRSGRTVNTTVQLQNSQGTTAVVRNGAGTVQVLGATLRALTAQERGTLGVQGGVMVTQVGTGQISKQTNMRNGFVILSINDQAVGTVADAQRLLASGAAGTQIAGIYPGGRGMYYYGLRGAGDSAE